MNIVDTDRAIRSIGSSLFICGAAGFVGAGVGLVDIWMAEGQAAAVSRAWFLPMAAAMLVVGFGILTDQ